MSWLFGRRSNGDEESDSDEYTDASASDDEYTSSSEEEDITDEKEDSDESAKAIELSLEDSPPRTSETGANGVTDETNDQRPGTAIIEFNDSHRAEISEEHANESRDDNLPIVESSGDAAISDTNAKSDEEESGANVRAEEKRLTATSPALVIDTDIIVSDNGDSINSSKLAKVTNRAAEKPANEDEELDPEFYKNLPTKGNCETKEEKVIAPTAGQEVHVNNAEVDTGRSTLTNDVDQDEGKTENDENASENHEEEEEELEEVTSLHEKRSLLVLAAEHDRVDILKAILADGAEDRATLLNSNIPPLHISIAYGSSNAVQSLLRMGADPSVRPDVSKIKAAAEAEGEEKLVDIPNMGRFDNLSAWELAFGKATDTDGEKPALKKKSSWFGGGSKTSIEIAPSKLEGIRHAFTAEGLRCIGSDESDRLKSLLDSGMPSTIDIGGKHLYDWSVEMGALKCEELLRPGVAARSANTAISCEGDTTEKQKYQEYPTTDVDLAEIPAVRKRSKPGEDSLSELVNRIDELESLAKALSSCLDNLAEEVSVCHGLLLMGGGASALASHVRSLKNLKENKSAELDRLEEAWENSEDELAYWVKESGAPDREIAELMSPALFSSSVSDHALFEGSPEEEHAHKQQLKAQALLLDNKVCGCKNTCETRAALLLTYHFLYLFLDPQASSFHHGPFRREYTGFRGS